ncbi:tyrosine-type recombinase/integrase [Streptomyces sp. WMMB 322]|uniref:tyrosine-type recombinase/integrase n=1 Tax=Streptomyces sp. WMMB 322 TaxID=1286821 RepID=UPI00082395F1|nr:tyrosine-type recombinase/integrase [Streptomyces sp. WMMB 322]SCK05855.1 Site-specific recombinase XerD [Streptomyces sp. WMMB 322]
MTKKTLAELPEDDDRNDGRQEVTPQKKRPYRRNMRDGIVKRGATWSYVVNVYDPKLGKSKPTWVGGFDSEDEAKAARDKARVQAREGSYVRRNRITVAEYLSEWIDLHAVEVKPRTLSGYRWIIKQYVVPNIGGLPIQDVRPATITRLYTKLREQGGRNGRPLSPGTINHVHTVLRKAFRDAVDVEELLSRNPVERAKRPRRDDLEPGEVWTKAQLRAFLRHASHHRLGAFFHLAAYTGARRGELLFLRWNAVDVDQREVTFRGSTGYVSGERIEGTTKTGRSRTISIDQATTAVLKGHRAMQDAERAKFGMAPVGTDDHVFANEVGEQIHPDTVSSLMTKLIASYNSPEDGTRPKPPLQRARLHDLRHLHATMLLLAKVPVHVVAARLGHRDPSVTLRVYAHVIKDIASDVAETFAAALKKDL